jgi:hypothetical protein
LQLAHPPSQAATFPWAAARPDFGLSNEVVLTIRLSALSALPTWIAT